MHLCVESDTTARVQRSVGFKSAADLALPSDEVYEYVCDARCDALGEVPFACSIETIEAMADL